MVLLTTRSCIPALNCFHKVSRPELLPKELKALAFRSMASQVKDCWLLSTDLLYDLSELREENLLDLHPDIGVVIECAFLVR